MTARLNLARRSSLEPALLQMTITALHAASGSHRRREVFVSELFRASTFAGCGAYPVASCNEFSKMWPAAQETGASSATSRCRSFDDPDLWEPRGTEVHGRRQVVELSRSPLHFYAHLIAHGILSFPDALCGCLGVMLVHPSVIGLGTVFCFWVVSGLSAARGASS